MRKFAGPAFCVEGRKLNTSGWLAMPTGRDSLYDSLDERVPAGSVMLFATGGYDDTAVFGGGTGVAMQRRGVAGVIVMGYTEEISQRACRACARQSAIRFVGRSRSLRSMPRSDYAGLAGSIPATSGDQSGGSRRAIVIPVARARRRRCAEKAAAINALVDADVACGRRQPHASTARAEGQAAVTARAAPLPAPSACSRAHVRHQPSSVWCCGSTQSIPAYTNCRTSGLRSLRIIHHLVHRAVDERLSRT
jgi:hypothetical protein